MAARSGGPSSMARCQAVRRNGARCDLPAKYVDTERPHALWCARCAAHVSHRRCLRAQERRYGKGRPRPSNLAQLGFAQQAHNLYADGAERNAAKRARRGRGRVRAMRGMCDRWRTCVVVGPARGAP